MPSIDDLIKKHKEPSKKFQKKSYRPWDVLEETSDEESSKPEELAPQEEVIPVVVDKKAQTPPLDLAPKVIVEKKEVKAEFNEKDTQEVSLEKEVLLITHETVRDNYHLLYGVQKNILHYLVSNREKISSEGSITKPITHRELSHYTRSKVTTISVSLQRLKEKGWIKTATKKTGRGGFGCYFINQDICEFIKKEVLEKKE
jgi:predicted transcriptional regulator